MGNHYHRRGTCRLCGGAKLANVFSLAPTPLANAFVKEDALGEKQNRYPLDVFTSFSERV